MDVVWCVDESPRVALNILSVIIDAVVGHFIMTLCRGCDVSPRLASVHFGENKKNLTLQYAIERAFEINDQIFNLNNGTVC